MQCVTRRRQRKTLCGNSYAMVSRGLRFRRQHAIDRYIVDYYRAGARLVIEVDSPIEKGPRLNNPTFEKVDEDIRRQTIGSTGSPRYM